MNEPEPQHGPIEVRAVGEITAYDFSERTIDIVVIPYERETQIVHEGRVVREVVSPGAFDGIERRPGRVRVNYNHQDNELRHQLGRVLTFAPGRPEGLVARLKIRNGKDHPEAQMALEQAADGDLAASAGFGVMPGGERWEERRTLRRLTRLFLDHVALTPTPAYPGTEAIAVRAAELAPASGTPNLDAYRELMLADRLARLVASEPHLHRALPPVEDARSGRE